MLKLNKPIIRFHSLINRRKIAKKKWRFIIRISTKQLRKIKIENQMIVIFLNCLHLDNEDSNLSYPGAP